MMNELLRKRAIAVMDRIMSHPSTIPFHQLSVSDSDGPESAIDLWSIRLRLQTNRYTKLQLWLNDVEQCWLNAERRIAQNPIDDAQQELVLARAPVLLQNKRASENGCPVTSICARIRKPKSGIRAAIGRAQRGAEAPSDGPKNYDRMECYFDFVSETSSDIHLADGGSSRPYSGHFPR
jgi:hypothetical protein